MRGRESCLRHGGALPLSVAAGSRQGGGSSRIPDRLETNRCHWFMHSSCYGRLAEQLSFDPPQERLSVPRFLHREGGGRGSDPGSPERRTAPLLSEETQVLRARVDSVTAVAFLNTDVAASFAACTWLVIEWMTTGKPHFLGLLTGAERGFSALGSFTPPVAAGPAVCRRGRGHDLSLPWPREP